MKRLLERWRAPSGPEREPVPPSGSERVRALVASTGRPLAILDDAGRVTAASPAALATVPGLEVGALAPPALLEGDPLVVPLEANGRTERLVEPGAPSEQGAYEALRAGFTAVVSHELRTPLARLLALLESAELPRASASDLVPQAKAEVEQMRELIDDVLFLSELESGREVVSLGSARALPVLEEVVAELAPRAERAGVSLAVECPPELELPLRPRMLRVLAENLAVNALRYAGPGATFTLSLRREGGALVLAARDDGAGVPEEDLPRLFERFYRADRARASRGTGLGLAIVKHVVVAAGGRVEARGGPGRGLEVRCTFPA